MDEKVFCEKILELGGHCYIVGGWIRDRIIGVKPKDKDYVICGLTEEQFRSCFKSIKQVGNSFPVFQIKVDEEYCEVALARKERKFGAGYKGFKVDFSPEVTIEEDLYRRDTAINAIAFNPLTDEIIDPYGGEQDIKNKVIRPVSTHFKEDPVRALRAARQAAVTEFKLSDECIEAMKDCKEELQNEPSERIFHEMELALASRKPSVFFNALRTAGLLETVFPEIAMLIGKEQPVEFHPEGDAYVHSMMVLDKTSEQTSNVVARFAALVHDLGKGLTPTEMLPHHYDHETKGVEALDMWNKRMTIPKLWYNCAVFVITEHMRAPLLKKTSKIVDFIISLNKWPLKIDDFLAIIEADHGGLPVYLKNAERELALMLTVSGNNAPAECKGPAIGDWIRQERIRIFRNSKFFECFPVEKP